MTLEILILGNLKNCLLTMHIICQDVNSDYQYYKLNITSLLFCFKYF